MKLALREKLIFSAYYFVICLQINMSGGQKYLRFIEYQLLEPEIVSIAVFKYFHYWQLYFVSKLAEW